MPKWKFVENQAGESYGVNDAGIKTFELRENDRDYEVGDEVRDAMRSLLGAEAEPYFRERRIDLKGLNRKQLELSGVRMINVSPVCTCCSHTQYWSHRYTGGMRGTQAGIIILGRDEE